MIRWETNEGSLIDNVFEGEYINVSILYDYSIDSTEEIDVSELSSSLPKTININNEDKKITISGILPLVENDTTYNLTERLVVKNKQTKEIVDINDRYFYITNHTKTVSWKDTDYTIKKNIPYVFEDSLTSYLENSDGTETFKKIGGRLPSSVIITERGMINGFVSSSDDIENSPYNFIIRVYRDGKQILPDKEFSLIVEKEDIYSKPMWITESGVIGSFNNNDSVNLSVSVNESKEKEAYTYYKCISPKSGEIFTGVNFNNDGSITGVVDTTVTSDWEFTVVATTVINGISIDSDPRTFVIVTNESGSEHSIEWDYDEIDLGTFVVGSNVKGHVPRAVSVDGSEIHYMIVDDVNAPLGLVMNADGSLSGSIEYQDTKSYNFNIKAETSYASIIKPAKIEIKKGLGRNAIKAYLRLTHENDSIYNEIKSKLNPLYKFRSSDANYITETLPQIDVAYLQCYDREVMSYLLKFGGKETVKFGKTTSLVHNDVDNDGASLYSYEVFYKEVEEGTLNWKEPDYGSAKFNITSEDEDFSIVNEQYDSNRNTIATYIDEETGIIYSETNYTTPHVVYDVCNIKNIRDRLSKSIYVYKKFGEYKYDLGSQKILSNEEILKYDELNIEYGIITNPYCFDRNKNAGLIQLSEVFKEDDEMVMPMISDDDVHDSSIRFLDVTIEPLPDWKQKKALSWVIGKAYNTNDVLLVNGIYYLCLQSFIADKDFVFDSNLVKVVTQSEMQTYLPKEYFPSLDIGYWEINHNRYQLLDLNEEEELGKYFTGKTFTFFDLVCEPIYNNEINTFGIPFVSLNTMAEDYPTRVIERTFGIIPYEQDYEIYIKTTPQYLVKDNTVVVPEGTTIEYSVSKDGYFTKGDVFKIVQDDLANIRLLKKCKITINPTPNDCIVSIKAKGYEQEGNTIVVPEGTLITYTITKDGYETIEEQYVAKEFEEVIDVKMKKYVTLSINAIPLESSIQIISDDSRFRQEGNKITVTEGTGCSYIVSNIGSTPVKGYIVVYEDESLEISLLQNTSTVIVNASPSDSEIIIDSDSNIYEQRGNTRIVSMYVDAQRLVRNTVRITVSRDGYVTAHESVLASNDNEDPTTRVDIALTKLYTVTFNVVQSNPTIVIKDVIVDGIVYKQEGNKITVPSGATVIADISKLGYKDYHYESQILAETTRLVDLVDNNWIFLEDESDYFVNEDNKVPFIKE